MQTFSQSYKGGKRTLGSQIKNILAIYREASPDELADGLSWYLEANRFVKENFPTVSGGANAISILSPQIDWASNKKNALLIQAYGPQIKIFATQEQKDDAHRAICGEYQIPPSALKTYNFARCIENPWDPEAVVVDRHAIKVAYGILGPALIKITKARYLEAAEAYRKAAQILGILPLQAQAVTWVTYKRLVNR